MSPPEGPRWPVLPGEHDTLPRLVLELYEAGDLRPAYGRVLISATRVLETANPDRLRAWARGLDALADDLEEAHELGQPGQQTLLDP